MINSFKNTPVYSIRSYSHVLNSEGLQTCYFSPIMAPIPSATARTVAEKHLQNIYKQKLKNYKQKYTYKAVLNQATFKVLTAFIAQAKLATEEIYQAQLTAIKKTPIIINAVETNFSKSSLPLTIKSLDLLFHKILIFKVAAI